MSVLGVLGHRRHHRKRAMYTTGDTISFTMQAFAASLTSTVLIRVERDCPLRGGLADLDARKTPHMRYTRVRCHIPNELVPIA
jgi:hypothetical protein